MPLLPALEKLVCSVGFGKLNICYSFYGGIFSSFYLFFPSICLCNITVFSPFLRLTGDLTSRVPLLLSIGLPLSIHFYLQITGTLDTEYIRFMRSFWSSRSTLQIFIFHSFFLPSFLSFLLLLLLHIFFCHVHQFHWYATLENLSFIVLSQMYNILRCLWNVMYIFLSLFYWYGMCTAYIYVGSRCYYVCIIFCIWY